MRIEVEAALKERDDRKVFIDTDLYGDKELKIATINKLKQKLRDAINKDNSVAPCMLELAINDALGYNVESTDGGPDGSIQFETEVPGNERLKKAVDVCKQIKKDLQRTNTVSFADIVAFGGAEALETAGCSRITVQIGRDDAKTSNKLQFQGDKAIDWSSNELKASDIRKSFEKSGLSVKEMGVLVSALGELRRVVTETISNSKESDSEDDDVLAGDQAFEDLVPSTFGSRDKMYGAKMGKGNFGTTYLKALQKGSSDDNLRAVLTGDPQVLEIVKKAAGSDTNFQRDVAEAYLKMTLLGEAYSTRNS